MAEAQLACISDSAYTGFDLLSAEASQCCDAGELSMCEPQSLYPCTTEGWCSGGEPEPVSACEDMNAEFIDCVDRCL